MNITKQYILSLLLIFSSFISVAAAPKKVSSQEKKDVEWSYSVRAMQSALGTLIHEHSNTPLVGDTIADELSRKFAKSPEVQVAIAQAYIRNHEADKAKKYLSKANALSKDGKPYVPALVLQGDIFRERDYIDSAAICYEKAMEVAPGNEDAYVKYAMMYSKYGKTEAGVAKLEQLRIANPNINVDALIADVYADAGDDAGANEFFGKVDLNKLSRQQVQTYAYNLYFGKHKDYERGYEVSLQALQKWEDDKVFKRFILWHGAQMNHFQEAHDNGKEFIDYMESNNKLDSVLSIDKYSMAYVCFGLKQYDEGFEYLKEMEQMTDRFEKNLMAQRSSMINSLSNYYTSAKNYDDAIELWKRYMDYMGEENKEYILSMVISVHASKYSNLPEEQRTYETEKPLFDYCEEYERLFPDGRNLDYVLKMHYSFLYNVDKSKGIIVYGKRADRLLNKQERSEEETETLCDIYMGLASYAYQEEHDTKKARMYWQKVLKVGPYSLRAPEAEKFLKFVKK